MDEDSLREAKCVATDSEILRYRTGGAGMLVLWIIHQEYKIVPWLVWLRGLNAGLRSRRIWNWSHRGRQISKEKYRGKKEGRGQIIRNIFFKARGIWSEKTLTQSELILIITYYRSLVKELYFLDNMVWILLETNCLISLRLFSFL